MTSSLERYDYYQRIAKRQAEDRKALTETPVYDFENGRFLGANNEKNGD